MMESLKSNLVQACDNERIILHCPKNTQILLENIFYGRLVPSNQLCPSLTAKQQFALDESISCDVVDAHAVSSKIALASFFFFFFLNERINKSQEPRAKSQEIIDFQIIHKIEMLMLIMLFS
ncbi:unnamed protein product [Brugia pahangi]|uniref:BTB domain-containing protein n=1 Tax=Brugia pahangi TaxID=6280 RepID=A0A0N4TG65_BRUPA|nr:unnamed protein product [Brugia pahangi]